VAPKSLAVAQDYTSATNAKHKNIVRRPGYQLDVHKGGRESTDTQSRVTMQQWSLAIGFVNSFF
jgi:hypothetical protein